MNQQRPSRRGPSRLHLISTCVAVCAAFFFAAQTANAQDIAEAARQEKARKATPAQKRPHVYTNEDLKRAQILTPEDRAPIEARKRNPTSPTPALNETSPADASAQDATASESLGEIARRVRQEKSARQAEQVRKISPPAPFHVELPQEPVLAQPKPLGQATIVLAPLAPKMSNPSAPVGTVKRDPFSRAIISAAPRTSLAGPAPAMKSIVVSPPTMPAAVAPPQPPTVMPTVVAPINSHVLASPVHTSSVDTKTRPNTVRIQSGDSLWNLSRRYLGKGSRWQEWLNRNPEIGDPHRLQPGAILRVPSGETAAMHVASESTISVQTGDSLWRIAATHLGSGAVWPCLAHANPDLRNVDRIYPGQTLQLPVSCREATPAPLKN